MNVSFLFGYLFFYAFILMVLSLWFPHKKISSHSNNYILFFLMAFALLAFRSLGFPYHSYILPDEAQALVEAKMFLGGGIPWESVDTTTCGPLNSLIMAVPAIFGVEPSYLTAQITSYILMLSMVFLPLSLEVFVSRAVAWTSLLVFWAFICFNHNVYLFHHFNVYLSWAMMNMAIWLAIKYFYKSGSKLNLFASALILGAIPYAKIQFSLYAVFIFTGLIFCLWYRSENRKIIIPTLCSALVVPTIFSAILLYTGAFGDFWQSYILRALNYGQPIGYLDPEFLKIAQIPINKLSILENILRDRYNRIYFLGTLAILSLTIFNSIRNKKNWSAISNGQKKRISISVLFLLVGILSIEMSKSGASYYLFLLFTPLIIFSSFAFQYLYARKILIIGSILMVLSLNGMHLYDEFGGGAERMETQLSSRLTPYFKDVIEFIKSEANPQERIAIWGYSPEVYLFSNTLPATRDAIAPTVAIPNPQMQYYRDRFLSDLKKSEARIFVDATGYGAWNLNDRVKCGFENDPELFNYIQEHYNQVRDFSKGSGNLGPRVYFKNK